MKFAALLMPLLLATPALAQPFIIPLQPQKDGREQGQPQPSPVPVAPPQAEATLAPESKPDSPPAPGGTLAAGMASAPDAQADEAAKPAPR